MRLMPQRLVRSLISSLCPTSLVRGALFGGLALTLAVAVSAASALDLQAQQAGSIAGQVLNAETGNPISGAQVSIPALQAGTLSNVQGRFELSGVPAGTHTVRFEVLGYGTETRSVTLGAGEVASITVRLSEAAVELEGVVVTALGISREARSLGYATEELRGPQLEATGEVDILNAMGGEVAGMDVRRVGPAGGSTRVVLRGASSILGENQPLIVVDGVPISNMSTDHRRTDRDPDPLNSDVDYGNALNDIDPSEIESVSILKGANAAALYGSRAANGAIVITTKGGSRNVSGVQYEANFGYSFQTPLRMPVYQNRYGQGGGGLFEFVDGYGAGVNDGTDESWGPPLDGRPKVQWNTSGQPTPWVPRPYNVRDFWETGTTLDQHIAASLGGEDAHARLGYSGNGQSGQVPGHEVRRHVFSLAGGVDIADRLQVNGRGSYTRRSGESMPEVGYTGNNPNQTFMWFGRQIDTRALLPVLDENGRQRSWNFNYHDNPYWETLERESTQDRQRFYGFLGLTFTATDWLDLQFRSGTDWFTERRERNIPKTKIARQEGFGSFEHAEILNQEINHDLIASARPSLAGDFSLELIGGANLRQDRQRYNTMDVDRLNVDQIFNVSNAASTPTVSEFLGRKEVWGLYGSASLGWQNMLFLDVTARNDWSSTLPEESNSYFYPSVSTSFVFTEALQGSGLSDHLAFGKVRASWARVGSDAEPYQLRSVLEPLSQPFRGHPGYSVSRTIPNVGLRPEETDSWEVGLELRGLEDRAFLDLSYYNSVTKDQILPVQVSKASGFESRILNAGEISNKGVEAVLGLTPIQNPGGLTWDVSLNFAKNVSKVVKLHEELQSIVLGEFWRASIEARAGETYGTIYGFANKRDEQGRLLLDENGFPMAKDEPESLGHYPPDWTGGVRNSIRHGDKVLSFLVDVRQGGEIFSVTNQWGKYSGIIRESVEGREGGYVYDGVHADGTPNTTAVSAQDRWKRQWSIQENNVFDASFIKLREVSFSFGLPDALLSHTPFGSARLAIVGRNLALLHSNIPHVDPETGFDAGNMQGVEYGQFPAPRSVGFNLSIRP